MQILLLEEVYNCYYMYMCTFMLDIVYAGGIFSELVRFVIKYTDDFI